MPAFPRRRRWSAEFDALGVLPRRVRWSTYLATAYFVVGVCYFVMVTWLEALNDWD